MIPLFSVSLTREADSYAINELGMPGILLMENASVSIFNKVSNKYPGLAYHSFIGFVCGKGNNGGDGFAAARHFANSGAKVKVIYIAGEDELSGDALENFLILQNILQHNSGSVMKRFNSMRDLKALEGASIIFDAMLGTGAKPPLKEPYGEIVKYLNKLEAVKVAVDIPTGLDADTGDGGIVFKADYTISLAELKKGLFVNNGALYSGQVEKGYIGIPEKYFDMQEVEDYLIEPEDAFTALPLKRKDLHKYSAGKVLVLAGSARLPGAAFLTASSVLKAGAGSSLLCFPESLKLLAQIKLNEAIVEPYSDEGSGILKESNIEELKQRFEWMDVLAVGPGLGRNPETISAVQKCIEMNKGRKIVIDADGITALGNGKYRELPLKNCILTPHHGEFAGMLGISAGELRKDFFSICKEFVSVTGSYLVLKGAPTVIFTPDGDALINPAGNAGMAKFGTGDVLTGVIAAFAAQSDNVEDAVIAGVYLHSLSADLLLKEKTEFGITATSIINNLPAAINFLRNSFV